MVDVNRINELARIAKQRTLTPEEEAERAALRAEYLVEFRASFGQTLDNTVIEYPDGTKKPLQRKG